MRYRSHRKEELERIEDESKKYGIRRHPQNNKSRIFIPTQKIEKLGI